MILDNAMRIGVVGMGVIGKSLYKGMSSVYEVRGYDINPSLSVDGLDDVVSSDFVFLCLPTPSGDSGAADTSFVHEAVRNITGLQSYKDLPKKPIFVLRSTVPVGTTSMLARDHSIDIVHCPEFISQRSAEIDFITSTRVVLGSDNDESSEAVAKIFRKRFPGINVIKVSPEESEFIKYFLNSFYATKITFFNEMRLLSDRLSLNWDDVMLGVLSSGWVEKMHTDVPGPDGLFGYGGACFPKDVLALSSMFKENSVDCLVLDAVMKQNNKIRWGG